MTELATTVLSYLRSTGNKSFTIHDLTTFPSYPLPESIAKKAIDELEVNGHIEVGYNIANTFRLK